MITKLRLILSLLCLSLLARATPLDTAKATLLQTCKAAELVSYVVFTHLALGVAHEAGHVLAAKMAANSGSELAPQSSKTISLEPFNYGICPTSHYPIYANANTNLLVTLAGPAFGFSAIYSALKSYNIYLESQKKPNFKQALVAGFKKDLIHADQNSAIRAGAIFSLCTNIAMMFPFKINTYQSHGYQIINYFAHTHE